MRIVALLVGLAACGRDAAPQVDAPKGAPMACSLAGAAEFRDECTVSRSMRGTEVILTIVAPNGSFRRVAVADGAAVASADGAEPAVIGNTPEGATEFSIASDRYRLPSARP